MRSMEQQIPSSSMDLKDEPEDLSQGTFFFFFFFYFAIIFIVIFISGVFFILSSQSR